MSPEKHMIMLDRFARIDKSATQFFADSDGLGLALVYRITSYLGGTLDINTSPDKGTTVTITAPGESVLTPYIPPFTDGKKHIVYVMASDPKVQDTVSRCLSGKIYTVMPLTDPEEIVEMSKSARIEAVLVEGDRTHWPRVKHAVARIPANEAPIICSICEVGQSGYFTHSVPKATLICRVSDFMAMVRFGKVDSGWRQIEVKE